MPSRLQQLDIHQPIMTGKSRLTLLESQKEEKPIEAKPIGLFSREAFKELRPSDVGEATLKVGKGFANTFVPAITNFFKTTGNIFGEGLAYAVDKNVREQYKAGNLEILPTITETTQPKLAKDVIAAGIETAVYRSFPEIAKMKLFPRGGAGALQGLGFAVASGLAEDKKPEEIIKDMPAYGVGGGVLGVLSPYLLPILKAEMKQLPNEIKNVFKGLAREIKPPKPVKIPVEGGVEEAIKIPVRQEPITPKEIVPETTPAITEEHGFVLKQEALPGATIEQQRLPGARVTRVPREQLPVGEGETRVSRLESRIKGVLDDIQPAKAEQAGITTYQQMNKTEQISNAVKYVEKNPDEAMAVLRGEKPAPAGLLHNSIALALEEKATQAADANLAIKLASLRSTRAGQEISILTEAQPANPITQINEIIKARAGRALRKLKTGETIKETAVATERQIVSEVNRMQLKIAEAEKLLDTLVC